MYIIPSLATGNSQPVHKMHTKVQLPLRHPSASSISQLSAPRRHELGGWLLKPISFSIPTKLLQSNVAWEQPTSTYWVWAWPGSANGRRGWETLQQSAEPCTAEQTEWGCGELGTGAGCCRVKYLLFLARVKPLTLAAMKSLELIFCCVEPCIDVYPATNGC